MKKTWIAVIAIAVVVSGGVLLAQWTLGAGTEDQAAGTPEQGGGAPGVGDAGGRGGPAGWREAGLGRGMGRGYVQPTPESKALWDELGVLQARSHTKEWELFEALAEQPADQGKVTALTQELRQLRQEMAAKREQLRQYWKALPGAGGGPGGGGAEGRGRAGRRGFRGGEGMRGGQDAQPVPEVQQQ